MTKIEIHPSVKAHNLNTRRDDLIDYVTTNKDSWFAGDRDGIWHCRVPAEWVKGEILHLLENVTYEAEVTYVRRKGVNEEPRQSVRIKGVANLPSSADVILYSHELLGKDASSEATHEVVAIRGLMATPNPRPLNTLLHNIFEMSGGTLVIGTAEEKLKMIEESFLYWKDRAMVVI
jgi:hypothetical protein